MIPSSVTATGRAAKAYKIDAKELLSVLGKKIDDVPAHLKAAFLMESGTLTKIA